VWGAVRRADYAQFFRLLRRADLLQACLMRPYVGDLRVLALERLEAACVPHVSGQQNCTAYSLDDLRQLLVFEDMVDARDFCTSCGLDVEETEVKCVVKLRPRDASGRAPPLPRHPSPPVRHMARGIDAKIGAVSLRDACRGKCSAGASRQNAFDDDLYIATKLR
jgi:hypothetical protein